MPGPAEYEAAGLRIIPIDPTTKSPRASGFGKDAPTFSVPARDWGVLDGVAILTGPCPWLAPTNEGLLVIDLDGDTNVGDIEAFLELPMPRTLSSKGGRHLYYRVPLDAPIKAWVRVFGRGEGRPEVDFKWAGGYAIEPPGKWDAPQGGGAAFDLSRVAKLPADVIEAILAVRGQRPSPAPSAAPGPRLAASGGFVAMGPVSEWRDVIEALAASWPEPGGGCHEAALALGGVLGQSHWSSDDIAVFSGALFEATCTKDRTNDVLTSVATKRAGGAAMGWPTLKAIAKDIGRDEEWTLASALLRDRVPGLRQERLAVAPPAPRAPRIDASRDGAEDELLAVGDAAEIASIILDDTFGGPDALVFDEGKLWVCSPKSGLWREVRADEITRAVLPFSGRCYRTPEGKLRAVHVSSGFVSSVRALLEGRCCRTGWFADAPQGIAFQNGFLSLPSRVLSPLDPQVHRRRRALPCDYGPDAARRAPPVNWVRYLRSIWGDDRQSIDLIHQMIGYLLSGRHDHQKIFLLLGPPRAGKGTLLNLIAEIFGDEAGPFKVSALDSPYGMACMLGKSVCFDADVRRGGGVFRNESAAVERLLSISAADLQSVPRKYLDDALVRLGARLVLAANPPFGLADVGGALASRLVIATFPRSFLGAEDRTLGARLAKEIPSIVALALDALDDLDRVGKFVEPDSSAAERESVERAQNPMQAFVDECCELGDFEVGASELYAAAARWREENGHKKMSNQAFGEFMRQKGFVSSKSRAGGAGRPRVYRGIRITPSTPRLTVVPK